MKSKLMKVAAAALMCVLSAKAVSAISATPDHGWQLQRVAQASAEFVERFNAKDSQALGRFYTHGGVLKLLNQLALSGRDNVAAAWQGGFDAGLDFLELNVEVLEMADGRRALESGTYALTIQTPGGPILQTGTYAVHWRVSPNPFRRPRITFDAIDAD